MQYEKGAAAVVIVIIVITALLALIGGLVLLTSTGYRSYHFSKNRAQALYLAEAGISSAIREIKDNEDHDEDGGVGSISETSLTYSDNSLAGSYWVDCVLGDSSYTLTSTGIVNKGSTNKVERTVEVTVEVTVESESTVFDMATFAGNDDGNGITIDSGVTIDSYDSEGTGQLYDPATAGNNGDIGTNSISTSPEAVTIGRDSDISGNVYIGEGGDPDLAISGYDNGGIALSHNKVLPEAECTIPADLIHKGDLVVVEEEVFSNGWYDSIIVGRNGHLTFSSDVTFIYVENMSIEQGATVTIATDMTLYVAGEFEINKFAELYIQDNHKLTLYIGETTIIQNFINESVNSLNLIIYGLDTCTGITIDTTFYGAIYARKASIVIKRGAFIYGSIVGDTITIENNASIHYDEALASVAVPGSFGGDSGSLVCKNWKEL